MKNSYSKLASFFLVIVFAFSFLNAKSQYQVTVFQPDLPNIQWVIGNTYLISWEDNFVKSVNIKLINEAIGATVTTTTIKDDVEGSTFSWYVDPAKFTEGTAYRVRVESSVNQNYNDLSNNQFSLVGSLMGEIKVIQPKGGEKWLIGQKYLISWEDDVTGPVKIQYKKFDAPTTGWTLIKSNVSGSTYEWNTTGLAKGEYKIRVMSMDGLIKGISDNVFDLVETLGGEIEILQPNGGEKLIVGSKYLIAWNDDVMENLVVELINNTATPTTTPLGGNVSESTLEFTVPDTPGEHFKIRVASKLDGTIEDLSDNEFSIVKTVGTIKDIFQPEGGEVWLRGTKHLISWEDDISEPVEIHYRESNSSPWKLVGNNIYGSTHEWDIPPTASPTTTYQIRIRSSIDNQVKKVSNTFSVVKTLGTASSIELIQPNVSGITWLAGEKYLISWIDDLIENVKIELIQNSTTTPTVTAIANASSVSGSTWEWQIPSTLTGDDFKIKISSVEDGSIYGESAHPFSIGLTLGTDITVIQPNGGEQWLRGSSYWISWEDDFLEPVQIQLLKNGSFYKNISNSETGSTFIWTIPANYDLGDFYKIRIRSTLDNTMKDLSDGFFSIVDAFPGTIEVIQPNGGEIWVAGSTNLISWDKDIAENVKIELIDYSTAPPTVTNIVSSVSGTTYNWPILENQTPGTQYKIKVSSIHSSSGTPPDESNNYFTIMELIDLNVYPNPGDPYVNLEITDNSGSVYTISLIDRFGTTIRQSTIDPAISKKVTLSTADLPNGIYFLNAFSGQKKISRKVVIQH